MSKKNSIMSTDEGCCIAQPLGFRIKTLSDAERFITDGYFWGSITIPDVKRHESFYVLRCVKSGEMYIGYGTEKKNDKAVYGYRRATHMDIYTARTSINRAMFTREPISM